MILKYFPLLLKKYLLINLKLYENGFKENWLYL